MTIDERIVQLGLNNKNFEQHAEQSMKTLDKLHKSLEFKGGDTGLDQITGMLEKITDRFSVMGIAGDQVIRRLTNSVMDLVGQMGNLAKSMSIDQISEGFSKYGSKTEAVQTIMAATAKDIGTLYADEADQMAQVNAQLEKLNWFTDETSYSFLDMVNNIGKFTSNGRGLEESVTAMEGISTWAAISGAKVGEAGRAMYNLSQALGLGAVTTKDWMSIENANMATYEFKQTAIETAEALGMLKKVSDGVWETTDLAKNAGKEVTVQGFRENLSQNWFSSDVLLKTLDTYGRFTDELNKVSEATGKTATQILKEVDAVKQNRAAAKWAAPYMKELASAENDLGYRAFKAAQEAKTFEDAINATKDAVSTGWMNLFEKMFGNYLEVKKFWTSVAESFYDIFAEPVNKLNDIFEIAFGGGKGGTEKTVSGWKKLEDTLAACGHDMEDFEKAFSKVASDTNGRSIDDLVSEYGSLEAAFRAGAISADTFKQVLQELTGRSGDAADEVTVDAERMTNSMSELREVALGVLRGDYGNGDERRQALEAAGYDYELIQFLAGQLKDAAYLSDQALMDLVQTYKPEKMEEILKTAGYTEEEIAAINDMLANSDELLTDIINDVGELEENKLSGRELFTGGLLNILNAVKDSLFAVDEAFDAVFGDTDAQGEKLYGLLERFHAFTETLQVTDEKAAQIRNTFIRLFKVLQTVGSVVGKGFGAVRTAVGFTLDLLDKFHQRFKSISVYQHFGEALKNIFDGISYPLGVIGRTIKYYFRLFRASKGEETFNKISQAMYHLSRRALEASQAFKEYMTSSEMLQRIGKVIRGIGNGFKTVIKLGKQLGGILGPILTKIWEALKNIFDKLGELKDKLKISGVFGSLQKVFDWISSGLERLKTAVKNFTSGEKGAGLTKVLTNLLAAFLGFKALKGIGGIFGKIGDLFGGIGSIGEFLKNPASIFKNFVDGLKEMFGITEQKGSFVKDLRNIAVSIGILALSLMLLASIPEEKIASAMGHLTTMLVEMIGAIKTLDFIKPGKSVSKAAVAMIAIAAAMVLLAASLKILSKIDPERLTGAWEAMTFSLLSMVAVLYLISKIQINTGKLLAAGAAMLGIASAMLVMSAALWIFSKIDPDQLTAAWEAMALSLFAMVIALYALSNVGAVKMLAAGVAMVMVAASMVILAAGLELLSLVIKNNDDVLKNFAITMAIMVGALALLGLIGPVVLAAGAALLLAGAGLAIGALGLLVLCHALNAMNDVKIKPDTILSFGGALIALGIAGVIFGLGGLGLLIGGAGLLVLAIALRTMNGVSVAPDYLLTIGGALIALGIAGVIFGLGGVGLLLGGAGLLVLAIALKTMNGVTIAPDYLLALGGALIALGIGGLILGLGAIGLIVGSAGLAALAVVLPSLAEGVRAFSDIGGEALKSTFFALAEAIGALFLLQFSTIHDGVPVLKELAEALPSVATGFKSFEDVNGDSIALAGEGLSKAIGALFTLQFASFADGVPVLKELSEAMPGVATGFKAFESLDPDAIGLAGEGLTRAIGALFTLQFTTFADGVPVLKELSGAMPGLSSGFKSFEDMDGDSIAKAGEGLGTAINALFTLQFASFRDGSDLLFTLSSALPGLATGFESFNTIEPDAISNTGIALKKAINTLFELQFTTIRDGTPSLTALADALPKIASGFNAFQGTDKDWLKGIASALENAISTLANGGFFSKKHDYSELINLGLALSQFWDGLSELVGIGDVQNPITTIVDLVNGMKDAISNSLPDFEIRSGEIIIAISNGITTNAGQAMVAFAGVLNAVSETASGYGVVWPIIGGNIAVGLANGIYEKSYAAVKAASELATAVKDTVQSALDIHSPSRVMARLGAYASIGLGQGIQSETDYVKECMITAISPALATLAAMMDEDFEFSPKITPVVDLSNVNGTAGMVNDVLGGSYGISAQVSGAVSSRMADMERIASSMETMGQTVNNNGDTFSFAIYQQPGEDAEALTDRIMSKMQDRMVRRGVAFG